LESSVTITTQKQTIEEIKPGKREIYIHYGAGMGKTKLKLPAAETVTARNINTVTKFAALAAVYTDKL
jgi:uncharacterized protein (DUF1697 family)